MIFELHLHTYYSFASKVKYDGVDSPKTMIQSAKSKGINGVVITDHNTMKGLKEAKEAGKKYGVLIIPGEEITSSDGHVLAVGIQEAIKPGLDIFETIDEIHRQGGLSIGAHPFDVRGYGTGVLAENCDVVEVFNALNLDRFSNKKCRERFPKKAFSAGSDAHSKEMVGNGLNKIEADDLDSLLKNMRNGRNEIITKYPSIDMISNLITKRLQMSYEHTLNYINKEYRGPKRYFSENLLPLVKKSPGKIDYLFKAMYLTSLAYIRLYGAVKYLK